MYTMAELVRAINDLSASGLSWGDIAAKMYPDDDRETLRPLLWRIARDGYYPKNNRMRKRLSLSPLKLIEACPECGEVHLVRCPKAGGESIPSILPTSVVVVIGGGDIPPGAQVISASLCECGQWFISNHPRRRRCFICRPYKRAIK